MEANEQVENLARRRSMSNVVGCSGCAGTFIIPMMIVSSGSWGLLTVIPLVGLVGLIVAIVGWISAGNRGRELALLKAGMNQPSAPTGAPLRIQGSGSESSPEHGEGASGAASSSGAASPTKPSMADRIEKARRAGH